MSKYLKISVLSALFVLVSFVVSAQCSICSKTASQMGEEAGRGLNAGILYLAAVPFAVVGYIWYRWKKNNG